MLRRYAAQLAAPALNDGQTGTPTNGQRVRASCGARGARGQAAAGFPAVFGTGLPALERALKRGWSPNDAAVYALLRLMAQVEDTNVIIRSTPERAARLRAQAAALLGRCDGVAAWMRAAAELDAQLIAENISPGGCADLLAASLFLHFCREDGFLAPAGHTAVQLRLDG